MMSGQADTLYLPIWISVSVLNLIQNSGFGRTLAHSISTYTVFQMFRQF